MKEVEKIIEEFQRKRGWMNSYTPDNLAKSIIIESAELLEHFQWGGSEFNKEEVEKEIADVLIYTITLCRILNLDMKEVIKNKIKELEVRYPAKY